MVGLSDEELASAHKVLRTLTASMDQFSRQLLEADDQPQFKKLPISDQELGRDDTELPPGIH
jgi:hypothetical protein